MAQFVRSLHSSRELRVVIPFALLGTIFLASIVLPLAVLSIDALSAPGELARVASDSEAQSAVLLSLEAALLTAVMAGLLGIPLAWLLARVEFPGKGLIQALVDVPLTVPHVVAGIAVLFVYGRRGLIGAPLHHLFGLTFWGSLPGIVVAMLFVSAPFTVSAARLALEAVDPRLERAARSLGAGPWRVLWSVVLPLSWRGLLTAMTLGYARAVSEFGSVVIIAYYPMTAPVKIYDLFLRFGLPEALALSFIVLVISLFIFIALRVLAGSGRQKDIE
ncbi:MAG: ABC transporter permease [Gammaproteobacteria bacterium]|jgi:molybdate/tungstate transport system permease protein